VTDIDPRWMGAGTASNIELRRHDIVDDELDEGRFDLVHARLVLPHLPERRRALAKMLTALKPGGWLLIDDFDCSWLPFVPQCREAGDARLFLKVADAFHQVLQDGGVDIAHGRGFYPLLLAHGLANVEVDGRVQIWPGGSPGALLWQANIAHSALTVIVRNACPAGRATPPRRAGCAGRTGSVPRTSSPRLPARPRRRPGAER
jgi:SAM-dependent methyltransferase